MKSDFKLRPEETLCQSLKGLMWIFWGKLDVCETDYMILPRLYDLYQYGSFPF